MLSNGRDSLFAVPDINVVEHFQLLEMPTWLNDQQSASDHRNHARKTAFQFRLYTNRVAVITVDT